MDNEGKKAIEDLLTVCIAEIARLEPDLREQPHNSIKRDALQKARNVKEWCEHTLKRLTLLCLLCVAGTIPPGLLDLIQYHESRGGTGRYFVIDVVGEQQLQALYQIARHVGRPAHRFKGSSWGAMGIMQIRPATFWAYRTDGDGDGITDPESIADNRATAETYLTYLMDRYGCEKALLKYSKSAAYSTKIKGVCHE